MSTMDEISKSKVVVYFKPREGFVLSVSRDLVTFGFILLCIYVSHGSTWWTFITGIIFLLFMVGKLNSILKRNTTTFDSEDDAIEYLQNLKTAAPEQEGE